MAKQKSTWEMVSWGLYGAWNGGAKKLPPILKFCDEIPARIDVEFGYILNIKKAKGKKITYRTEHPPFKDSKGMRAPAFKGELYVRTNDWNLVLGDAIWDPVHDKIGPWRITTKLDGIIIADKTLMIVKDTGQYSDLTGGI
jgi:hypothetical protein